VPAAVKEEGEEGVKAEEVGGKGLVGGGTARTRKIAGAA
jgi:hypothetical protein